MCMIIITIIKQKALKGNFTVHRVGFLDYFKYFSFFLIDLKWIDKKIQLSKSMNIPFVVFLTVKLITIHEFSGWGCGGLLRVSPFPSRHQHFWKKMSLSKKILTFWAKILHFRRKFLGPLGIFTNLKRNFRKSFDPSPLKIFLYPYPPPPQDFCAGSCMLLTVYWKTRKRY